MLQKFSILNNAQSFYFKDPDTKQVFQGVSIKDLSSKVRLYRLQNELPDLPFLETVIENYLCHRPENKGKCIDLPPLKRGLIPTIKGGITILKNLMYNTFADQAVADSRSEICKSCPHNVFLDKDKFIEWSDWIAENSIGDRKSSQHNHLGNCDICSCPLRSKVFYTGPLELTEEQIVEMPSFCWQKKEALNDRANRTGPK